MAETNPKAMADRFVSMNKDIIQLRKDNNEVITNLNKMNTEKGTLYKQLSQVKSEKRKLEEELT